MAPNHDAAFYSVFAIFIGLSTLALGLRIFSRKLKCIWPLLEDYLVAFAWILAVGQSAMIVAATKYGGQGRHATQLGTPEETQRKLTAYAKTFYAAGFLQTTSLAMSKLSILVQLHRIFVTRWFRRTIYGLYFVVIAWWLASMLLYAFLCWPVASNWDPTIPHKCGDNHLSLILVPLPWMVTDFFILLLPLPIIWGLQLNRGKKLGLIAIFLTGGFTCIVACVRYRTLFIVNTTDPTWSVSQVAVWNIVETSVSVICACMLVIQPALKAIVVEGFMHNISSLMSKIRSTERLGSHTSDSWTPFDTHGANGGRFPEPAAGGNKKGFGTWTRTAARGGESGDSVPLHQVKRPQESYDFV